MDYLIVGVTFLVFIVEAMLHYLIGHNSGKSSFSFKLPSLIDFGQIALVVGLFSFINGVIISKLENK